MNETVNDGKATQSGASQLYMPPIIAGKCQKDQNKPTIIDVFKIEVIFNSFGVKKPVQPNSSPKVRIDIIRV